MADHQVVRYVVRLDGEIAGLTGFDFEWNLSTADGQI